MILWLGWVNVMSNIVEVKLDYSNENLFFRADNIKLNNRLTVVVDTDRGLQFGKVVNIIDDIEQFNGVVLGDVVRLSTKKDYYNYLDNKKISDEALKICRDKAIDNKLDMNPIFNTVFKALAVGLGTAVFVLSVMKVDVESESLFMMLGMAVACLGLSLFDQKDDKNNSDSTEL